MPTGRKLLRSGRSGKPIGHLHQVVELVLMLGSKSPPKWLPILSELLEPASICGVRSPHGLDRSGDEPIVDHRLCGLGVVDGAE